MKKYYVCWALLPLLALTTIVAAQEKPPLLNKTVVLELQPGEGNPRNSEGAFLALKNGDILFAYSRYFGNSSSDHAAARIAGRFSSDEGKTWSAQDTVLVENEGKMNVMSVSLLRLNDGEIALFYLLKNAVDDCSPRLRKSSDEGKTWSEPIDCIVDDVSYFVMNNDRVLQLPDGTLLFAVARHGLDEKKNIKQGADIFCYISKDTGRTWARQEQVPNPENFVLQEPGLVNLADGRLLMYLRTNAGRQLYSFSSDGGKTWSAVEPSPLIAPLSPALIKRIPDSEELIAVWNDNPKARNPINIAILDPTARTIRTEKILDECPDGPLWFCYPALDFLDKENFLIGYCAADKKNWGLNATRLIRSSLRDIRE